MAQQFPFTIRFSAGSTINTDRGTLTGVTVAEVGEATGHFAFIDREGRVLGVGGMDEAANFKGAARRLPLCMDEKSLVTLVAAGQTANRVKAREDHDDSVGARAGFVDGFRLEDGKAVCDLHVFTAYRNRGTFFEAASLTPELIGLSGDFKFNAEVVGDRALMRVVRVDAVDIVDQGALTHAGLFQAKATGVDRRGKETPPTFSAMAKTKQEPDGDEVPDLGAFKTMCESIAAYRAKHAEMTASIDDAMAAISPVKVATPDGAPAPVSTSTNPDAAVPGADSKIAASMKPEDLTQLTAAMSAIVKTEVANGIKAAQVDLQKQFSALGLKPAGAPAAAVDSTATAPATTTPPAPKDFLSLKAAIAKDRNISPVEATRVAMKENPDAWTEYQVKLGIIKKSA